MVDPLAELPPPASGDEADDEDAPEAREREIDAALHGLRLDKALVAVAPEFSRSHLQGLIGQGHVQLDGQVARTAARAVRLGQRLRLALVPTAESRAFRAESIALSVVFEDAQLLVIDKPAGMVVHPAAGNWSGTLLNALLAHHADAARLPRAGIVHRLDKDTSGLMVVAKTLPAMTALVRAIAAREVQRQYLALAHGVPREAAFTVDAPIGRDARSRIRMAVAASGKPARTDFERLGAGQGACALRCTLHSGRTHQIRVHLASRGHPLLGDALYGGAPLLGLQRQALHAARLRLAHPVEAGRELAFDSPLPADLRAAWDAVTAA